MANSWPLVRLGESCSKIGSGATPRGGSSVYQESGDICLVRSQNIYNDGFKHEGLVFIDVAAAGKLKNVVLEPGDILLNITGDSVARVCLVEDSILPARVNQHVAIIRPLPNELDARFVRYYLTSAYAQRLLLNLASAGATRSALTKSMIEAFEVPKPALNVQIEIAEQLEAIEFKVKANQEINQTIEQIAQVLFKSWFVDFDPVFDNALASGMSVNDFPEALQKKALSRQQQVQQQIANGELEVKPLPEDIHQFFPSEFEQTDEPSIGINGWIPKGWSLAPFSKVATLKNKSVHPNREPEKLWTQFSLPAFDAGQIPTHDLGIEIKSGKYKLSENTVLVSKLNPHTPRIWMPKVTDTDVSVCSTEFMPFEPVNNEHRVFVYSLMNSENVKSKIASRVTGTTGSHQRVSPKEVAVMPVLLPSLECITSFSNLIKSSFDKVELNLEQNIELTKLIDTLLPKLISGELQLQE